MTTFVRFNASRHDWRDHDPRVACDACSTFDPDGFPLAMSGDDGERCWDFRWSMEPHPCAACGRDANVRIPWETLPWYREQLAAAEVSA